MRRRTAFHSACDEVGGDDFHGGIEMEGRGRVYFVALGDQKEVD